MDIEKDKTNTFINRFIAGLAVAFAITGVFILGYYTKVWTTPDTVNELEYILEIIQENYVGEFDESEFIRSAVKGTLDRYSTYYSPVAYDDEITSSRDGVSQGKIGVSFSTASDSALIVSVDGNSPAEKAGVVEGGEIVGVIMPNQTQVTAVDSYSSYIALYNEIKKDTPFTLIIDYDGEERSFIVQRGSYVKSYVHYQDSVGAYNFTQGEDKKWVAEKRDNPLKTHINNGFATVSMPNTHAYLKLDSFHGGAAEQVKAALELMVENGADKLILDLRNNGGGYMDILTDICEHLAPGKAKQVVSSAVYKSGKAYDFKTEKNFYDNYGFKKIVALGNSGTASASEALIGAMVDYDQSCGKNIVSVVLSKASDGKFRTYGKGIMQTTYEYSPTGSAIKLTTAQINWPHGRCIHGVGITPETDSCVIGVSPESGVDAELLAAINI